MSLKELVSKYIASTERAFGTIRISKASLNLGQNEIVKVVEFARAYLNDAKYFREQKKFEVSLTSIAYCEGILDTLKLLGAIEICFEQPH